MIIDFSTDMVMVIPVFKTLYIHYKYYPRDGIMIIDFSTCEVT